MNTSMAPEEITSSALIDTSALLALANPRDQYHEQAVSIGHRVVRSGNKMVGTVLVLAEFHAHFLYLTDPARARAITTGLLNDPVYEWRDVSAELLTAAVSGWLDRFHDQAFSLADAVSFEMMSREGIELAFAFDKHFRTAGFRTLT